MAFTKSDLKHHVTARGSKFFSRQNMKFAGDTMKNYGIRTAMVTTRYDAEGNYVSEKGVQVECWELYRIRPVKAGLRSSVYFCKKTYEQIHSD